MAEYWSETIKEMIENINAQKYILPAMQRSFVWPEDKIYHLFDSLMHDYPIGTFLFWKVDQDTKEKYAFNLFIKDVDEQKGKLQRGEKAITSIPEYVAVLDGQQRITSLYIGVEGKWRTHEKGKKRDKSSSYYDRYLCIDFLSYPTEDDDRYHFEFIKKELIEKIIEEPDDNSKKHYWVKVSKFFDKDFDTSLFVDEFQEKYEKLKLLEGDKRRKHRQMLQRLQDVLIKDKIISYYTSKDKPLPEVIDIFVRVNSGGQKLSASDLMLSIASGTLGHTDIHKKMQDAIDSINDSVREPEFGFKVDKDLILTAGLMMTDAESLSLQKQDNYKPQQMEQIIKTKWEKIIKALSNTVQYIEYLGFIGKKLTSKNLILPISYYFFVNDISDSHKNSSSLQARRDRVFIRQWMLRAMINDVFLEGTGATLIKIRNLIKASHKKYFPLDELMKAQIKRPLNITDDQIEDMLSYEYGDPKLLPLLMDMTAATIDQYHLDHIWAKNNMKNKTVIKKYYPSATDAEIDYYKNNYNKFANLQLLRPTENQEKNDTLYDEWIKKNHSMRGDDYFATHLIPQKISYAYDNFREFTEKRNKILRDKIKTSFPDDFSMIEKKYSLDQSTLKTTKKKK